MHLINFSNWDKETYSEISQKNPMRWMNVKPLGGDVWEPVTGWWKCKDFMNDVVTSFHLRKTFYIYGFKVNAEKFFAPGQEELYFLVKNITPEWEENMVVVNDYLLSNGFPAVYYENLDKDYFISLDKAYLHNTYFISAVTLLIRMANVNKVYQTLDDMVNDEGNTHDTDNYTAIKQKPLSEFPEHLLEYIWYYDKNNNTKHTDKDKNIMTSQMHNCGVVSWGWK